jgi:hypothetical protein
MVLKRFRGSGLGAVRVLTPTRDILRRGLRPSSARRMYVGATSLASESRSNLTWISTSSGIGRDVVVAPGPGLRGRRKGFAPASLQECLRPGCPPLGDLPALHDVGDWLLKLLVIAGMVSVWS